MGAELLGTTQRPIGTSAKGYICTGADLKYHKEAQPLVANSPMGCEEFNWR